MYVSIYKVKHPSFKECGICCSSHICTIYSMQFPVTQPIKRQASKQEHIAKLLALVRSVIGTKLYQLFFSDHRITCLACVSIPKQQNLYIKDNC